MKKIYIALLSLFMSLLFVTSPAYAYYNTDSNTDLLYTKTYQSSSLNQTINGETFDRYTYLITLTAGNITDDITIYFNGKISTNGVGYWLVAKSTSYSTDYLKKPYYYTENTLTYIDNATLSAYLYNTSSFYLILYTGLSTQSDIETILFPKISISKISNTEFYNSKLSNNIDYQTGYTDGYNQSTIDLQDDITSSYNQGYADGIVAEDNDTNAIVSFLPRVLGAMWNGLYVVLSYEIPLLNISLLSIIMLAGLVTVVIVTIKAVRG